MSKQILATVTCGFTKIHEDKPLARFMVCHMKDVGDKKSHFCMLKNVDLEKAVNEMNEALSQHYGGYWRPTEASINLLISQTFEPYLRNTVKLDWERVSE